VVGIHFINPTQVMKLVEVICGYTTSDGVTNTIVQLSKILGKLPVEVNDFPGFVMNIICLFVLMKLFILDPKN
jgi:3-hydroxybutyryl-CoA dehydrogenase